MSQAFIKSRHRNWWRAVSPRKAARVLARMEADPASIEDGTAVRIEDAKRVKRYPFVMVVGTPGPAVGERN